MLDPWWLSWFERQNQTFEPNAQVSRVRIRALQFVKLMWALLEVVMGQEHATLCFREGCMLNIERMCIRSNCKIVLFAHAPGLELRGNPHGNK